MKKKKSQHTLVFKYELATFYPKEYAILGEAEWKELLMRKGYLYIRFKREEVIRLSCITAKANWPKEVRMTKQKEINDLPPQNVSKAF